jgi:hypothetical protein
MVPMMSTETQMCAPSRTYSNAITFLNRKGQCPYPMPSPRGYGVGHWP